jgi:hypothetical protein
MLVMLCQLAAAAINRSSDSITATCILIVSYKHLQDVIANTIVRGSATLCDVGHASFQSSELPVRPVGTSGGAATCAAYAYVGGVQLTQY